MKISRVLCALALFIVAPHVAADHHPPEFDWRTLGKVSAVKSQGQCGSSWLFPVTAALESKILIESGVEIDLSEQHVLSCSAQSTGCGGDWFTTALIFIQNEGVVAENVFPYEANDDIPCPDSLGGTRYSFDQYEQLPAHSASIQQIIYDRGPVIMAVEVYQDFQSYQTGIYRHETGSLQGGHAMLFVGYGQSGQGDYLVAKNSWGTWWGEDGYIRIFADDIATLRYQNGVYVLDTPVWEDTCNDLDGDGFGIPGSPVCPGGLLADCDDDDAQVYPGAQEICDGIDNNCDGTADDETDSDGDGFLVCDGDCDDFDPLSFPGAVEQCDGIDNNCDGVVPADEVDSDLDGYMTCGGDCDDASYNIHPGALEIFDGSDNNCDGQSDEGLDADSDGIPDFNDVCNSTVPGSGVGPDGCAVCSIVLDADGDGVLDDLDACAMTPPGEVVHPSNGCSISQLCPCEGPIGGVTPWMNHGKYVSCVANAANAFESDGVITEMQKGAFLSAAGQSTCGK